MHVSGGDPGGGAGDQNKARDMITEATQAIARIIQT